MKQSKLYGWMPAALVGLALSTSVGFSGTVLTIDTFDNATTSTANMWNWYGGATYAWDGTQDHTGNGGGSIYIKQTPAVGADTIIIPESFPFNAGSGTWNGGTPTDLTLYTNISCWFKWDTNSTMSVSDFNTLGNGGFAIGLFNSAAGWPGGLQEGLGFNLIAGTGAWEHFNYPLTNTLPNINSIIGVEYYDWKPAPWTGTAAFWIDDVIIQPGTLTTVPPPVIHPLGKVSKGLNVFNSSSGIYDREEVYFITNTGTSWIGQPGTVSYSFTISGMPSPASATSGTEAYFFLSPNPTGLEGAPDWNEPNMVIAFVQQDTNGNGTLHFQYKINEPSQQAMYSGGTDTQTTSTTTNYVSYSAAVGSLPGGPIIVNIAPGVNDVTNETGNLGSVTNPATANGTWTIQFSSDTNVTLIAPGGDSSSFVIPPYNIGNLGPGTAGMRIYLGGQANNTASINQAVVYSSYAMSGTAADFSNNFLTDTTLNTNLWSTSVASKPAGVLIVPASAAYSATWSLPSGGFSLQDGSQVADLSTWTPVSKYPVIQMVSMNQQYVDSSELPAGKAAFFNLIKRVFSQMQVLLPGETNAPGTLTGKTGSPTPLSLGTDGGLEIVTVLAVDAKWYPISGVFDTVQLSSSDGLAVLPLQAAMANGVVVFPAMQFNTVGSQTVTATDTLHGTGVGGTIPPNTSTPVTVGP